ncbi:ATP-dependent RNA helicase HrpA [Flaviflexus huanghaiensis]|uniref:ATP-dependent RNA helicase HrpA n=1 Tax=Flaviflexus huanghaiensis TaxID=1111473 RepID=UPI0015F7D8D2|nr:ATP-dependent RNA helicase HrpA [Flaviflexus huanghaiensis]
MTDRETRRAALPTIIYPDLPVSARRDEIARAIADHQVVIVAGETGSGKTTQLPKICLELGRGIDGMIGHTQPRRIAARSVAERISFELGVELGEQVGYQVRFTDQVSDRTLVKLMTDGILLAEIQGDPLLTRYDTIIIDEAHERSLNIDFLLGYLAQLLPQRPDLKLIITSATIDSERFAEHFGPKQAVPEEVAPIISVSGRTYPVEIRYREPDDGDLISGIVDGVDELTAEGPGDILVFLSGEGEIRDADKALQESLRHYAAPGHGRPGMIEVLPLYARLSSAEQHRIFAHHEWRRIILSTNIAETSLTVPGIRYVIDPGTARISRYSNKTKVQRLPIEDISQASANQRSGRCGRVADGIAIRLYSEDDYESRPEFTEPEIQRTSLASVILQMAALGLGEVADFPFVDPPQVTAVRAGLQLLDEIGAIKSGRLTQVGRKLAQLPIDPRLGRMLLEAQTNGVISEVLVIVAALSVQDVRERPSEKRVEADAYHERFTDPRSDFIAYLNVWRYLNVMERDLSGSAFRRLCRAEYLNYLRFREWRDVVLQLRQVGRSLGARRIGIPSPKLIDQAGDVVSAVRAFDRSKSEEIHKALLVGLLSSLGSWDERRRDYEGSRGSRFIIWPGSGLAKRHPSWVMAAELVETSRLFARTVAQIEPEWVEPLASHVMSKVHSEPFWSTKHGAAMVHEKVMLYGLTLIADRQVLLSKVGTIEAHELAREMFIRHALVENQWRDTWHPFIKANRKAIEEAREVEQRRRVHGLLADSRQLEEFFDERLPDNIVSAAHFNSWYKKNSRRVDLRYPRSLLLGETEASTDDYPDTWVQRGHRLPISYDFNPGSRHDGITITVPVTVLPQLTDDGFDWLVPGMLSDLAESTIRSLPKRIRRELVPAPDVARAVLALLPAWDEVATGEPDAPTFREAFSAAVQHVRGVTIDEWGDLPEHLSANFRVVSGRGKVLAEGPSITYLQKKLAPDTRQAVARAVKKAVATAIQPSLPTTGFGSGLPLTVEAGTAKGYPALVERGGAVKVEVLDTTRAQAREHRLGVLSLATQKLSLPVSRVTSRWSPALALTMAGSPYPTTEALVADLQWAAVRSLAGPVGNIRTQADFDALVERLRNSVEDEIYRLADITGRVLGSWREVLASMERAPSSMAGVVAEVKDQVDGLVYNGFLKKTPAEWLPHLPRYLSAARLRIETADLGSDDEKATQVAEAEDVLARYKPASADDEAAAERARWLIEELRVSLFAQKLGTSVKVSLPRIRKLLS